MMTRRAALAAFGALAGWPALASDRGDHWADQAALLDPACHLYARGLFDFSVPAGETWYAINAWYVRGDVLAANSGHAWFHRRLGEPVALPGGTRVFGTNEASFLWYARPSLVMADPRYRDAEALWYERMARANTLPLETCGNFRAAGLPPTIATATPVFPDFERGLLRHVSVHDLSWLALTNADGARISNMHDEINDIHQVRFTARVWQPWRRSMFDRLYLGHGAFGDHPWLAQGDTGFGTVLYQRLPADW